MKDGYTLKETFCALEKTLEGDDRLAKRNLLDRLVVLLFTTDNAAPALVEAGGIPALLSSAQDRDEKIRLHAVHALSRLAESGYSREIREAGGIRILNHLLSDPYRPLREMAEKAIKKLDIP